MTNLQPAVETLLHSWGSDTPAEVYWGLNEMVSILNPENTIYLPENAIEELSEEEYEKLYSAFMKQFIITLNKTN